MVAVAQPIWSGNVLKPVQSFIQQGTDAILSRTNEALTQGSMRLLTHDRHRRRCRPSCYLDMQPGFPTASGQLSERR